MRASLQPRESSIALPSPPPLDPSRDALFLDLDGTLVEIAPRPHAVVFSQDLHDLLQQLELAMRGAVALLTGRTISEADRILHGALRNVAGVHGYEIQRGGSITRAAIDLAPLHAAMIEVRARLQAQTLPALVEDKHASIALHYRHAPESGSALMDIARSIAALHGLRILQGNMVIELVAGHQTKGDAVRAFLRDGSFRGRRPIALGDDATDEDSFEAAHAAGGFGILIGPARATTAQYRLDNPAAARAWLRAVLP